MELRKLVFNGDSITEGYGDRLCLGWAGRVMQKLVSRAAPGEMWTAANLGCSGDTIADGVHRIADALLTADPSHMILSFGANDTSAVLWPEDLGPKINLSFAKRLWLGAFENAARCGVRVAVVGVLPVNETRMPFVYEPYDEDEKGLSFTNARLEAYNDMLRDVTRRKNVPFVDLFEAWKGRDLFSLLLPDGVHPTTAGYDLLAEEIDKVLQDAKFFMPR